jgi:c-di-GMP-binding flagellar brake protein YcgR
MSKKKILHHLKTFFPQAKYQEDDVDKGIEEGVILNDKAFIANILKGTLHDESLVEVELNNLTRVFFCRVLDHPPEAKESASEEESTEPDYAKGSYLNESDYVVITPLEPSIGNFLISPFHRANTRIVLRTITSRRGYEFGCYFDSKIQVGGIPVLQISFPTIARKIEHAREFRAKVPKTMEFNVLVKLKERDKRFSTFPLDISAHGMVLIDPMGIYTDLKVAESIYMELQVPGQPIVIIEATIKHVTRMRTSEGSQYCFGIQFDLTTRALASSIEGLVALVQRTHLRELSDIAKEFGVDYESW